MNVNTGAAASFARYIADLQVARWNAVIPKCAKHVQKDGSSIKYLHPTKGWRWVHTRRLAGAEVLL
jgi:Tfp pilus assembly protein FimT